MAATDKVTDLQNHWTKATVRLLPNGCFVASYFNDEKPRWHWQIYTTLSNSYAYFSSPTFQRRRGTSIFNGSQE